MTTVQRRLWEGTFGDRYISRNKEQDKVLDTVYTELYGVTRTRMNRDFLSTLPRDMRILEVGANFGTQLHHLQRMGFKNLYGIDVNKKAIDLSQKTFKDLWVIYGDALDLPFKDNSFDLVYTSGVLIHIAPKNLPKAMAEIHRVSKSYIWGFEYFEGKVTEINYRGHKNALWKAPYARLYLKQFKDLKLVKEQKYPYRQTPNVDAMFLLKKR